MVTAILSVSGAIALSGCLWVAWEGIRALRMIATVLGSIRVNTEPVANPVDGEAFARLRADVGLLPMTWAKVLGEITEQAEKATRERDRIDKVWTRAKARIEKSEEGDPGLESELESAGVAYEVGSAREGVRELRDGMGDLSAVAYKFGGR